MPTRRHKRGSHTSIPQLRAAILAYVAPDNERRTPFKWVKTADRFSTTCAASGRRFARAERTVIRNSYAGRDDYYHALNLPLRVQQVYGQ